MFASMYKLMFAAVGQPIQSPANPEPKTPCDDPLPTRSARREPVTVQSVKSTTTAKAAAPATKPKSQSAAAPAAPMAKTVTKKAAKTATAKPPSKVAATATPATKAPLNTAASKASMTQTTKAAIDPTPAPAPGIPPRSPRPSSRLTQLTVPSMAQSIASTAAKASYLQTMPSSMIAPPSPMAAKKDARLTHNWKTKTATELNDEEIIAMPDSEYMNDRQLAYFRLKLVQLKTDILNNAGETTEHLREDTVVVPDPADRATIEEEHALELRTRDRERKLLKKIEQSIQRIDAGDYGYCDETGEVIGVGRLLARPTATLCLEAQQRRELKQKMFGD